MAIKSCQVCQADINNIQQIFSMRKIQKEDKYMYIHSFTWSIEACVLNFHWNV